MSRKKKILILCHLSLAFTYFCWLLMQPYIKEMIIQKSELALYETVMKKDSLLRQLPPLDQVILLEGYAEARQNKGPSLLHEVGRLFFIDTPPFALAWLFFSLVICLLLLFRIEGALLSVWLLPFCVIGYAYFLYDSPQKRGESLFPSEEYVLTTYVESAENNAMGRRERLLLGWHRYLVQEWALEEPSEDLTLFSEQLDKGLFAFNVARLKWIIEGKDDEIVLAGFTTPPSLLRIACYFIWNLFFAWFINRKEKHLSAVAPSIPTC
jgi:hypothetical protein